MIKIAHLHNPKTKDIDVELGIVVCKNWREGRGIGYKLGVGNLGFENLF